MELLEHSPLGGSGAYRWMPCPGSVRMSRGHTDHESEYAAEGTFAHALASTCLDHNLDAWTRLGDTGPALGLPFSDLAVDADMADAVQVYLDAVREAHPDRNQANTWVERLFHCPSIHELMYGKSDTTHLDRYERTLHIWDYKHGAGIVVDVQHNPQLMYYGVGMLEDLGLWGDVDKVILHVAQPRGWMDPIRSWSVSVEDLEVWRDGVMIPAMDLAQWVLLNEDFEDHEQLLRMNLLNSGEHCRFCAARYHNCPRHERDMEKMEALMTKIEIAGGAPKASNEELGMFLSLFEVAKIRAKAFRETGFMRAQGGNEVPGWKLVRAKSDREWKDDTVEKIKKKFKEDAMVPSKLRSPAQIDKLPGGKAFTVEHAFKPDKGLQLVLDGDKRQEAGPKVKSMFKPVKGSSK